MRRDSLQFWCIAAALVGVLLGFVGDALAGDTEVHGYGYQGYLKSEKNSYLDAKEGTFDFTEVAVLFTNKVTDNTTVWLQLFGNKEKFGLDWAFVDYRFNNAFSVKAGQAKFPIGLINEYLDNKILHLSMLDPIMYREEGDIIFEAYRGVGATYEGGPVTLDAFGGAPVLESDDPTVRNEVKNLAGGRVTLTPLEGLTLMGSYAAYREEVLDASTGATIHPEGTEQLYVASAKVERGGLEVNAEYARKKLIEGEFESYYLEAGYHFFDTTTPYVRYDAIQDVTSGVDRSDPSTSQKETVVGVGYKVNPYFAIKAEEHWISGYLLPVNTGEISAGDGTKDWNLFVAGINFMF